MAYFVHPLTYFRKIQESQIKTMQYIFNYFVYKIKFSLFTQTIQIMVHEVQNIFFNVTNNVRENVLQYKKEIHYSDIYT